MYKKVFTLSAMALLISACGGSSETKPEIQNAPGALTLSGNAEYGSYLKVQISDPDGISNLSTAKYQWQRNSVNIDGATDLSYTITTDDFGHTLRANVVYVDDKGFDNALTSAQTAKIATVNSTGIITIEGINKQAQILNAVLVDGNGFDTNHVSFTWLADDEVINGQTSSTLILGKELVGKIISVEVNYTDQNGFNERLTYAQTAAIETRENSPGVLSLSGANDKPLSLEVGATLQANLLDANTITAPVTYYWYSGDDLKADNNQTSYALKQTDIGKSIYVKAEYIDSDGYAESVLSVNTDAVVDVDLGIPGGIDYPVGASIMGNNPIQRNATKTNESFEGGGWNAGTIRDHLYSPGLDKSLTKSFRFVQFQGPHSFAAENTITRLGNYSAKLHWKHGDPGKWNGDVNKIDNEDRKAMFHGKNVSSHSATAWYGFSIYFPSNEMVLTAEQNPLFFQLHGAPDSITGDKEPGRQPPIALTVDSNNFNVGYGWDARKFNKNTAGQGRGKFSIPVNFASDYQDRWVDFVLQVRANPLEEKGFINLWIDGIQVLGENNLQIGYNDDKGLYPSWGWYQTGNNAYRTKDAIMYMDEFRHVEAADAGYYDVAPGYFEQ
ncbi:heparin lyase I family protein [Algibacillus agarilyticus]|uniref:heparin lyase I family protein n=1 Tax=Algibacillus agarilyticus TaxID=2234133 RepID=UPI000DD09007|nr:heparin lyase I family protein [Algibacillus agarilyticus]